ncbi:hypothetical protein GCM10025865_14690 [Paraoerskovia sediminicola]|uniref:Uncharacterized protein n=1 Tax=Paraoerskovia sediminicola TaxID=1138587 RepID=A0ABM8G2B9_9CELL|nr:hypothetical protein GCM10025865_14690 [Paraoerskovia sediminicola]
MTIQGQGTPRGGPPAGRRGTNLPTDVMASYGVGLTSRTGWSSTEQMKAAFPDATGRVCGFGGYATQSNACQIVAK